MHAQVSTGAADSPPSEGDGVVSQRPSNATSAAPTITFRSLAELQPYEFNARTHDEQQIEQVATSIVEFGWTMPVLEDAKGVVAGHARMEAAQYLYDFVGCSLEFPDGTPIPVGTVPVIPCDGWSDAKRRAYILADNRLALGAGWDAEIVMQELVALDDAGSSELAFFTEAERAAFTFGPGENGDASAAWGGMPEFSTKSAIAFRSITVHLRDQAAVDQFSALVKQPLTNRYLWFPDPEPWDKVAGKAYRRAAASAPS